jgi:hypothetical protein
MKKSVVAITQSSSRYLPNRRIVGGLGSYQKLRKQCAHLTREELLEHGRRELAAASAAMRQFRKLDGRQFRA